jgi:hypothetical protein
MKRQVLLCFSLLASVTLLAVTISMGAASKNKELPGQITEHYRNYNYISLFSSELEQEFIADSLMCDGVLEYTNYSNLDYCKELPALPNSERLQKVRMLMTELGNDISQDTNPMNVKQYKPGESTHFRLISPEMRSLHRNPYVQPSELYEIGEARVKHSSITVEVTVYQLEPATRKRLISQYGSDGVRGKGEGIPSHQSLIRLAAPASIARREVHRWVVEDGTWTRSGQGTVLLD